MTDMPPPNVPEPPAPVAAPEMVPPPPPPPLAPAKQPSKLRTYLSIAVLLVIVGGVLYAIRNNQDADDVKAGTCFDFPSASDDFSTVETKLCTEPHDAEAILVADYTDGDAYPISLSINRFFEEKCVPAAETYVGKPFDSIVDVEINLYGPTRDAWEDGKRQFTCYAESGDGAKLTKSVKAGAS